VLKIPFERSEKELVPLNQYKALCI